MKKKTKHRYIYKEVDQEGVRKHAEVMKTTPVYFQISYREDVEIDFINFLLDKIKGGFNNIPISLNQDSQWIISYLTKYKNDILSD